MASALRVLLISHGLPPESVGGVEQHVEGLAQALVADGHHVTIWSRTGRADHAQGDVLEDQLDGVPVHRVVYRFEGVRDLDGVYEEPLLDAAFEGFLADRSFDVAHVHHLTGLSTGLLAVLDRHQVPTVLTLHDYWLQCPRGQMWSVDRVACSDVSEQRCAPCYAGTFPHWFAEPAAARATVRRRLERARELLSRPQRIILPSARVRSAFGDLLPAARVAVVENGVDTLALDPLPPAAPAPGAPLRIGYLGTLIPSKGLDVLVAAFQALQPGTASLRIHGNTAPYHGDEGFLTRVFARLRPEDDVLYGGPYRTGDLPGLLTDIDVLAAPSLWHEAFGLTVREALAAGRPVLVSAVGGLRDAVVDGVAGRVLPPGDIPAWTAALAELAGDPDLVARLGRAAKGTARGFAAMAADLEREYRAAIALDQEQRGS